MIRDRGPILSFPLMHVVQDAARYADGEDRQVAFRPVLDASGDVDDPLVQLDLLVVEDHGVLNLDMVDFTRGPVLLFIEAPDLPAGWPATSAANDAVEVLAASHDF